MIKKKSVKAWAVLDCTGGNSLVPTPEVEKAYWGPYRVYPTLRAAKKERYSDARIVKATITYSLPTTKK